MERLPEDVAKRLRDFLQRLEGLGSRAIVNYIAYEFEVGGPSIEILEEAERLATREIEELKSVMELIKELKALMA